MGNPSVKLLDRVRQCIRLKGYSIRTEKTSECLSDQINLLKINEIEVK